MSGLRSYTAGTRAALQTLSRGSCYYPGCGEPLVKLVKEDYYINYEIAHIRSAFTLCCELGGGDRSRRRWDVIVT